MADDLRPLPFGQILGGRAVSSVVGAAIGRFAFDLDEYRRLLRLSQSDSAVQGRKSLETQRVGLDLRADQRKKAEAAGRKAAIAVRSEFDSRLSGLASETLQGGSPRYLPALEQLVAFAIMRGGYEAFRNALQTLAEECDHDSHAMRYAMSVMRGETADPPLIRHGQVSTCFVDIQLRSSTRKPRQVVVDRQARCRARDFEPQGP